MLAPYDPPPLWMLRGCAFAAAREKARMRRLVENSRAMRVDVE